MKLLIALLWLAALVLAAWTLSKLPLADIAINLARLEPWQWLTWASLNIGVILTFGARWQVLNTALGLPVRYRRLMLLRQAGQAVGFITPGPQLGGEPLQVLWLWRLCALPLPRALLALGLDRFYEVWVNLAVLGLAIASLLYDAVTVLDAWRDALLLLMLALGALTLGSWLLLGDAQRLGALLARMAGRWAGHPLLRQAGAHWQDLRRELQDALRGHRLRFVAALGISLGGWLLLFTELWLALHFVGVDAAPTDFLFLFVAMRLAMLLPVPGGIGTIETAVLWSFQLLQWPPAAALGLIALMRLRDLCVLLVGLGCLYRVRLLQRGTPA